MLVSKLLICHIKSNFTKPNSVISNFNNFKLNPHICAIHTTNAKNLFWEKDAKSGYGGDKHKEFSKFKLIKDGWSQLKEELVLFKKEFKEQFESDPILSYSPASVPQPGHVDKVWQLKANEDLNNWNTTCDSDHGEGYSKCDFTINQHCHGLFSGVLNTEVPKDGVIKRSGYCTIRTKRARKSFKRDAYLDWTPYTHLVIRLRGDGRSYMMTIATSGYFDQLWNDVYQYILFTRGGPYWQTAKIPLSKFFFSSKGRIQDSQSPIALDKVTNFGITAADKINGPFSLEIDYIGLEYVPYHTEEFAYEMYRTAKNIARN